MKSYVYDAMKQKGLAAGILGSQIKCADREVGVAQVIITRNAQRGDGTNEKPLRNITQVWSMDGELIAERDPLRDSLVACERSVGSEE